MLGVGILRPEPPALQGAWKGTLAGAGYEGLVAGKVNPGFTKCPVS